MIQQATASFHPRKGRYVKTHRTFVPLRVLLKHKFLPWHIEDFSGVLAGSSRNKGHSWPNAKMLRTANGELAEPGHPGIFLCNFFKKIDFFGVPESKLEVG